MRDPFPGVPLLQMPPSTEVPTAEESKSFAKALAMFGSVALSLATPMTSAALSVARGSPEMQAFPILPFSDFRVVSGPTELVRFPILPIKEFRLLTVCPRTGQAPVHAASPAAAGLQSPDLGLADAGPPEGKGKA
jgi:hypothetical protein